MIHREKAIVKTEPVLQVKEEPNAATNEEEGQQEVKQQDVKPLIDEHSNVIVMQQQQPQQQQQQLQQPTDDFENDPEAGPSGLQRSTPIGNSGNCSQPTMRRYPNDSSDDDDNESDDEREIWRPPAAFRSSRRYSPRFTNDHWIPYDDQATNNDSSNFSDLAVQSTSKSKNPTDEVIDLSENDSNATVQNAPINEQEPPIRSHEVLTAPDLQLDWLSDTSSDNELVCTIHDRNVSVAKKSQPSSNVSVDESSDSDDDVPAIDLTASDDEDNAHAREDSSNGPSWSRNTWMRVNLTRPRYRSLMRLSSYHDDNNRDDR